MKKKKGLSPAEKRRRSEASENAYVFNVKTKGMRDRLNPKIAARLQREDKAIPIKKHQAALQEMVTLQPSHRDQFMGTTGMFTYSQEELSRIKRDYGYAGMVPVLSARR